MTPDHDQEFRKLWIVRFVKRQLTIVPVCTARKEFVIFIFHSLRQSLVILLFKLIVAQLPHRFDIKWAPARMIVGLEHCSHCLHRRV